MGTDWPPWMGRIPERLLFNNPRPRPGFSDFPGLHCRIILFSLLFIILFKRWPFMPMP
jgi:hypothetical protein